jgi:hypothetical protein
LRRDLLRLIIKCIPDHRIELIKGCVVVGVPEVYLCFNLCGGAIPAFHDQSNGNPERATLRSVSLSVVPPPSVIIAAIARLL